MSDDEFEDAVETQEEDTCAGPAAGSAASSSDGAAAAAGAAADGQSAATTGNDPPVEETLAKFPAPPPRDVLPSERPKTYSGLWSVMKSAIGRDLSKITMPVQFNEPLSFLQRLCEDCEYPDIIDRALECDSSLERLAHVASFASTCFASSAPGFRVYKPFNPLLGETFELVDDKAGVRVVCEQVLHHPPVTALHAESRKGWIFREEYCADTKFRGSLKLTPRGVGRLEIPALGDVYTWGKPQTTVHNFIIGKLFVDQEGEVEIKNHTTGEYCIMKWTPYSSSKHYTVLVGKLHDASGEIKGTVFGSWDKGTVLLPGDAITHGMHIDTLLDAPSSKVLWRVAPYPEAAKSMYGFPQYSMGLNQPVDGVCPTDSRNRPDQRLLEEGGMEGASKEKHRLEEKQRAARKARKANKETYEPRWFRETTEEHTNVRLHVYKGGYWEAKHSGAFANKAAFADIF